MAMVHFREDLTGVGLLFMTAGAAITVSCQI